jgi:predicted regulator of Ras-like GTPase activity (Roadblock/LC7/MglB family)
MEHSEMEEILEDINAVVGVTGSFVCNEEGRIVAKRMPNVFDNNTLSPVGRTMAQTIAGLKIARECTIGDLDLLYNQGRLIVKNVGEGCLCILCVQRINIPLLNLTANVAVKKLHEKLAEASTPPPPPVEAEAKAEAEPEPKPEGEGQPEKKMSLAEIMAANIRY